MDRKIATIGGGSVMSTRKLLGDTQGHRAQDHLAASRHYLLQLRGW